MKLLFLILLHVFLALSMFAEQNGGFPEDYYKVLEKDINTLVQNRHLSQKDETLNKYSRAVSSDVTSLQITSVNKKEFPSVKLFTVVKDNKGNHVEGLKNTDFDLYVRHSDDSAPLGKKLSTFSLEEIGSVESKADVVFVIDSTGSMSNQINTVKNNIIAFVNKLVDENVSYRLAGFDYGDEVPYRTSQPFTNSAEVFKSWVSSLRARGGNDTPENPLDSIISAGFLDYRSDAQQIIVLITDAAAHVAGDGGNSKTTATYTATANAIGSKTFYYFSNVSSYSPLGEKLGGTNFNANALISKLSEGIISKYIVDFKDPNIKEDGLKRKVRLVHKHTSKVATIEYIVDKPSVKISGIVKNNDTVASVLKDVKITIVNDKTKDEKVVSTNDDGEYRAKLSNGNYTIVSSLAEYKDQKLNFKIEGKEDIVLDEIIMPRASIADEKNKLIEKAKKIKAFGTTFSTPYADEADAIISWAESLPTKADGYDNDPSDAQKEGLKRLIQASIALDSTNTMAKKDSEQLGTSTAEVIVGVLTLTTTFDKLQKQIYKVVEKLPDSDSFLYGWAVKTIKKTFNFVATKIGQLSVSIANMVLDFIAQQYPAKEYPVSSTLIDLIKDVVSASDGKPASFSFVSKSITPWISSQILIPMYANRTETMWKDSLDKSKSIVSADFTLMAASIEKSNSALKVILNNFKKMKEGYKGLDTIKDYITNVKNVLDALHKLDPVVEVAEKFPATAPYAIAIDKSLTTMDKALEVGNIVVAGSKGVISGNHLYHLSDSTKTAIGGAYENIKVTRSYVVSKVFRESTSLECSGDSQEEIIKAIDKSLTYIDRNNSVQLFADEFVDDIGMKFDCLEEDLDVLKAQVGSGTKLAYGKPLNYDLLSKDAYEKYLNLQVLSLGYILKVTSIALNASLNASEDGLFAPSDNHLKEELKVLLNEWKVSINSTSDALATAVDSISSLISGKPILIISSFKSDIDEISEKAKIVNFTAIVKNVGTGSASNVVLSLKLPQKMDKLAVENLKSSNDVFQKSIMIVDQQDKSINSISANSSTTVTWKVSIDPNENIESESYTFIVSVKSNLAGSNKIAILSAKPADNDGDGLPNFWEEKYGLDANNADDAHLDSDNDGLTNATEYLYGLSPKSSTDNDLLTYLTVDKENGIIKADVDGNGLINDLDLKKAIEMWHKFEIDSKYDSRADINGNGYIDVEDIMLINKYIKVNN